MATTLQKMATELNERFRVIMPEKFKEKFGIEITIGWSPFEMVVLSYRVDGEKFTPEQKEFISVFEDGYGIALNMVREAAGLA